AEGPALPTDLGPSQVGQSSTSDVEAPVATPATESGTEAGSTTPEAPAAVPPRAAHVPADADSGLPPKPETTPPSAADTSTGEPRPEDAAPDAAVADVESIDGVNGTDINDAEVKVDAEHADGPEQSAPAPAENAADGPESTTPDSAGEIDPRRAERMPADFEFEPTESHQ